MAAFKSLQAGGDIGTVGADADGDGDVDNPTTAADYYNNGLDEMQDFTESTTGAGDATDPDVLASELNCEAELAAVNPEYAEQAADDADALEAQLEGDPTQSIEIPGDDVDYVDVLEQKAQAHSNAGNPAGAVEAYNKINPDLITDPTKKEKAGKVKNFGLGKAKIEMGDVDSAFDYLKGCVSDVANGADEVQSNDYGKFEKINEALLAMAAVIEKLKAQNSTKLNDSSLSETFKDPKAMANKIDRRSEIYVQVVVVIVQQATTNFGDNVLVDQTLLDPNRKLLNEGMSQMSDFHFAFNTNDYAGALTAIDAALAKFAVVITNITDVDELADKVKLNLKAQAKLQSGLVSFFKFRISILKKEKNDDHRKAALKFFYEIREKYKFLAAEVDARVAELEKYENLVEEIVSTDFDAATKKLDAVMKLLKVKDKAKALPLAEEAVTKFNAAYQAAAATDVNLKKESLKLGRGEVLPFAFVTRMTRIWARLRPSPPSTSSCASIRSSSRSRSTSRTASPTPNSSWPRPSRPARPAPRSARNRCRRSSSTRSSSR
jgi:hypothetical protein